VIRSALIVLVACSSPGPAPREPLPTNAVAEPAKPTGDRCEQVIAKSRAVIKEIFERYVAKTPTEADFKGMLETCRAPEEDAAQKEELIACVLAAGDEQAIRTCWTKDLDVADAPTAQRPQRQSEAAINLNKIAKSAKTMFIVNATYPTGKAAVLPVGQCGCPAKCSVTNAWRTDPVWTELDFEIVEETHYRYTYESDGQTFVATAIGDLDCDGNVATWTMTGTTVNGNPTATLTAPQGVY